jgi:alanine dehydrogenase
MLIDPATGRPLCVIDGNAITTQRTGAAGGLGLLQLARQGSTRLCVFLARACRRRCSWSFALRLMPSLREVRYVTFDGKPNAAFEARFAGQCNLAHALDGNAAVADSEVVITATPGAGPLFEC